MTSTTLDVLGVLLRHAEDVYGLKIAKETGLATGTIYPILARLERAGYVGSHWESGEDPDSRGARRRYYRLTQQGREEVERILYERAAEGRRTSFTFRPSPQL